MADENLAYLMRIAIEGPDLSAVNLMTFLNERTGESDCRLYSCQNHINELFILEILGVGDLTFGGGGGGVGGISPPSPPSV